MFRISGIFAGWLTVIFGGSQDPVNYTHKNTDVISFSWLSNVKEELDNLFDLRNYETKKEEFDLEGDDIEIITTRSGESLRIVINYLYRNENEQETYKIICPYIDFLKEYVAEFENNKTFYLQEFVPYGEEDYFPWDNENWQNIKKRLD